MTEKFKLAAEVYLSRRLKNLLQINENVEIDMDYITCAEYQLFINEKLKIGKYRQPDHWKTYIFTSGYAKKPITGVRATDAEEFCDWLTQRHSALGFRYRIPTVTEAYNNQIIESQDNIGYWCQNPEDKVIVGTPKVDEKVWRLKLESALAKDFALAHTLISNIKNNINSEFDSDLIDEILPNITDEILCCLSCSLACNFLLNLGKILTSACDDIQDLTKDPVRQLIRLIGLLLIFGYLVISFVGIILIGINISDLKIIIYSLIGILGYLLLIFFIIFLSERFKLSIKIRKLIYQTKLINLYGNIKNNNLARLLGIRISGIDPISSLEAELKHGLNIIDNIKLADAFKRNLKFNKNIANTKAAILLTYVLWSITSAIYSGDYETTPFSGLIFRLRKKYKINESKYNKQKNDLLRIYACLFLIDERCSTAIPAWEGIRIVRERTS